MVRKSWVREEDVERCSVADGGIIVTQRDEGERMTTRTLLVGMVVVAMSAFLSVAQDATLDDLLTEADSAYDRWSVPFDFDAYEASLRRAVDLWEEALPRIPDEAVQTLSHVLVRLAQAEFELAEAYLEGREKEPAYERGKDHALRALRLEPTFDEVESADGFRAALRSATDVGAIFWYGNCLGQWLNYHKFTAIMGGVLDVAASFERSVELDETYEGGGPQRAMGSLIAQAYFVVGKNRVDCIEHFERAIELEPNHLEAYVSYAASYASPAKDAELLDRLLSTVLALGEDPDVMAVWPLYNTLSIERAGALDG